MKFPRHELRHTANPLDTRAYKGGGSSGDSNSPTTTNEDNRMALQDSVAIGEGGHGSFSSSNSTSNTYVDQSQRADTEVLKTLASSMPDAVKALASAGADVINKAGGAVVDLNRDSVTQNRMAFDAVVNFGAASVDKLIDASVKTTNAGTQLAAAAVQSFQPSENAQNDAMKWGLIAAAGLCAVVVLGKTK